MAEEFSTQFPSAVEWQEIPEPQTAEPVAEEAVTAPLVQKETEAYESESDDEPAAPAPRTIKGRISELTAARKRAEEDAAYWRAQAMSREPAKAVSEPVADPTRPKAEAYEDQEGYIEALAEWKAGQVISREREEQRIVTQQAAYTQREAVARTAHEDYDAVMADLSQVPLSPVMAQTILESEVGPQLAYYLATHPETAARLSTLGPLVVARELGKLEGKLEVPVAEPEIKARPRRTATAPITPVQGNTPANMDLETVELHEFVRMRNEQEKTRRRY